MLLNRKRELILMFNFFAFINNLYIFKNGEIKILVKV